MPTLSKSDESELLISVLDCSIQPEVWKPVLDLLDRKLGCASFLAEFDTAGEPTPRFGGLASARVLKTALQRIPSEGDRNAFQFLLSEACLFYPYCKTALASTDLENRPLVVTGDVPDAVPSTGAAASQPDDDAAYASRLQSASGLISPVWQSETSTILFGLTFPGQPQGSIDVSAASDTFKTVIRALSPGLNAYFRLERERDRNRMQSTFLSALDGPALLINRDRQILAHTTGDLTALSEIEAAAGPEAKLVFRSKIVESSLQEILSSHPALPATDRVGPGFLTHTGTQGQAIHSVFVSTRSGSLRRISIQPIPSPPFGGGHAAEPWFLIQISKPKDVSQEIENVLQDRYDLSQSEAHLARHLTTTGSMKATADHLGITRNTAKTHLRRIYEKTGVHTQLQLARLVHKLAGMF